MEFYADEPSKPDYSDCLTWFDGCNNCRVMNGGMLACTRKFCSTTTKAYCKVPKITANCTLWNDGCNNCEVENGKLGNCTNWNCFRQDTPKCISFTDNRATYETAFNPKNGTDGI